MAEEREITTSLEPPQDIEAEKAVLGSMLQSEDAVMDVTDRLRAEDFYLRAFDTANGKEIWKSRLPVGSQSGPMTYVSPKTGKQYIIINAGGARQSPDRGDYIIAYALPDHH